MGISQISYSLRGATTPLERLNVIDYYEFYRWETNFETFPHPMFLPHLPRGISGFCQGLVQFYFLFIINER